METIPLEEDTKDVQDADVPFRDISSGQYAASSLFSFVLMS